MVNIKQRQTRGSILLNGELVGTSSNEAAFTVLSRVREKHRASNIRLHMIPRSVLRRNVQVTANIKIMTEDTNEGQDGKYQELEMVFL